MRPIDGDLAEKKLDDIVRAYIAEHSFRGNYAAGIACDIRDNVIATLPTVSIDIMGHARWVPADGEEPCDEWDCTGCGRRMTFAEEMCGEDMDELFPYCTGCGARMDAQEC